MLTVHHLGNSQSDRVVWLCEELGLDYALKVYDRRSDNRLAPDDYKAVSPAGTAPFITDGDLILGESAAILEYIAHRYGGGRFILPPDHADWVDYLFWFHFSNGSLMPAGVNDLIILRQGSDAAGRGRVTNIRGDRAFALVNERLSKVPYLAGEEFTLADIMSIFPLTTMRLLTRRSIDGLDHLKAYLKQIGERPALKRAMEKGDPGLPFKID